MTYKVVLTHAEEGYTVGCPELPGCRSEGETKEEAISKIREAIREHLSVQAKEELQSEVRFVEVAEAVERRNGSNGSGIAEPFDFGPLTIELPLEWTSGKMSDLTRILDERQGR